MKAAELKTKSVEELKQIILDNRKALFNLRLGQNQTQAVKSSAVKLARQTIARAKTIMTEKKAGDAS